MSTLATCLREGTQHSHTAAENTAFMKCFLKGIVEREPFRKLLANLYLVYRTDLTSYEGAASLFNISLTKQRSILALA